MPFKAKEWQWAADLIEQAYPPLVSFTWGANRHALVQLREWIEQLPAEILASRPHFCLACVHLLWTITPHARLFRWLDLAETALRASLKEQMLEVSQECLCTRTARAEGSARQGVDPSGLSVELSGRWTNGFRAL